MAYTTIDDPTIYFNTIIYTGDGTSKTITGVGFQPDWVWGKGRNSDSAHLLTDSVRGATKTIYSNATSAEVTSSTASLTGFTSDGYTVNSASNYNVSSRTQVNWNWKAGGSASSNSNGNITSSVSANTTAGFSIVSYTGSGTNNDTGTIGHGLGTGPNFIIIKDRSNTSGWLVSSTALGWNNRLRLEGTNVSAAGTYAFGVSGVTPSSSTFTVSASSGDDHTNVSGDNYIAYCFAEKKGFSKFGQYEGNNNADGTFVYTGFKPAFVLIKDIDATNNWGIVDNKRGPVNEISAMLNPNVSGTEGANNEVDFTAQGFKWRSSDGNSNASDTYIYAAFAESPFVNSNGVPNNAR